MDFSKDELKTLTSWYKCVKVLSMFSGTEVIDECLFNSDNALFKKISEELKKTKTEYTVVTYGDIPSLRNAVERLLEEGWEVSGGLSSSDCGSFKTISVSQVMIRKT